MKREFCATAYILAHGRVLLHRHAKLGMWLPPGGHVESNETPPEAAIRETEEETGLKVRLLSQENLWVQQWNACSFERPYLCLLEEIPAYGDQPAHQHMDFVYLAELAEPASADNLPEVKDFQWLSWPEIEALKSNVEIFQETKEVLAKILASESALALSSPS